MKKQNARCTMVEINSIVKNIEWNKNLSVWRLIGGNEDCEFDLLAFISNARFKGSWIFVYLTKSRWKVKSFYGQLRVYSKNIIVYQWLFNLILQIFTWTFHRFIGVLFIKFIFEILNATKFYTFYALIRIFFLSLINIFWMFIISDFKMYQYAFFLLLILWLILLFAFNHFLSIILKENYLFLKVAALLVFFYLLFFVINIILKHIFVF